MIAMSRIEDIIAQMERNPDDVGFSDLCRLCGHYFGKPRHEGHKSQSLQNALAG